MKTLVVASIVKPVDASCNLACSYCYMKKFGRQITGEVMSAETLRNLINFFCREQRKIEFVWHGGEPLLAGINFYKKVVAFQKEWIDKGRKIENFVQSNGTLINHRWVSFFKENDFFVGVSLDGPELIHNSVRRYKNGKPTFEKIMRGIKLLKDARIFNGVICCVGLHNYHLGSELLDFFVANEIKKIKFLRVKGYDEKGKLHRESIGSGRYTEFLLKVFKRWIEVDDPEIEIRDIKSVVNIMMGGNYRECVYMGRCDKFVTIYKDGSIYACDSLPKIDCLCFGDANGSFLSFEKSLMKFKRNIDLVKRGCGKCDWFKICNGGCLQNQKINLISGKMVNCCCRDLKKFFGEIFCVLSNYGLVDKSFSSETKMRKRR